MVQNGDDMFQYNEPFGHSVIDNFLDENIALKLSNEVLDYHSPNWFVYDNPLEVKKALNNWYFFPPKTYDFFQYLNSPEFIEKLENLTGIKGLQPDHGLHGAGWHIQGQGSKLNVHLDYSIHPKLNLLRKINFIYYLTPDWQPEWGGNLEFWSHDKETNLPKEKVTTIDYKFNRLVLFDTDQNSWHGFYDKLTCPDDIYRKSIAMYYLVQPMIGEVSTRNRALYSPSNEQKNNKEILELIDKRVKL